MEEAGVDVKGKGKGAAAAAASEPAVASDSDMVAGWRDSVAEGAAYLEKSQDWMCELGLMNNETGEVMKGQRAIASMVWELRVHQAESVALSQLMPHIIDYFCSAKNESQKAAETEGVQTEFLSVFCRVVALAKCPEGAVSMGEMGYYKKRPEVWDKWTKVIDDIQAKVSHMPPEMSLLGYNGNKGQFCDPPVEWQEGDEYDSLLFHVCMAQSAESAAGEMSTIFRHQLKERIYTIGSILRIMHNFLMMDTEAEATAKSTIEVLVRKCFVRLRYILRDMGI